MLLPGWLSPPPVRAGAALWVASLLGLGAWGQAEWRSHRRLRILMDPGPISAD